MNCHTIGGFVTDHILIDGWCYAMKPLIKLLSLKSDSLSVSLISVVHPIIKIQVQKEKLKTITMDKI